MPVAPPVELVVLVLVGGIGVYVILTFRLSFHRGRLECVTCQVPVRKSMDGAVCSGFGDLEVEWLGGESVIFGVGVRVAIVTCLLRTSKGVCSIGVIVKCVRLYRCMSRGGRC